MKFRIVISFVALTLGTSFGQTVLENPKRAANPEAGRIVKLQEMIRIRDDGAKIVFKYPYQLQVDDGGNIHFANLGEFFKYDALGRFVYRVVKTGQGPGEAVRGTTALAIQDTLYVQATSPPKIMRFDQKGSYLGEHPTTAMGTFDFMTMVDGRFYAFLEEPPAWGNIMKGNMSIIFVWSFPPGLRLSVCVSGESS